MKVLVVGAGGREHALAWKVAQSDKADLVFVAPGNAGTARSDKLQNVDIDAGDISGLVKFAQREAIGLTIIGPETPLVNGIVDAFEAVDLPCFGPSKAAAMLEGSKSFAKEFLRRHNIPTPNYAAFTDINAARDHLQQQSLPIVIKADGLAAGKGVIIADSMEQADQAITDMLSDNKFGGAGRCIIIEEFIQGEEVSFIVMSDGEHILPLASSQDYKARDDGGKGPNTGGMGAYSPVPIVTDVMHDTIMRTIIEPTIRGMSEEGHRYRGSLYAGLMIPADGIPRVLEFNCRLGDPETQPIMVRLHSDLLELCKAALDGRLNEVKASWDPRTAVGVVLASQGYPAAVNKGSVIAGLDNIFSEEINIFHAGTSQQGSDIVTAGGRVLCVVALGESVSQACKSAYSVVPQISWDGVFYRRDIAQRSGA